MRYVKRRRKSKRSRRDNTGSGFLTITVIVCGVLIYVLYVSSAGQWIKKNYIEPVFFDQNKETTQDNKDGGKTEPSVTEHVLSLEGFTMYAMQTGAYSGHENAQKQAEEIRKQGGAGYVYKDDVYRVFAFGYPSEGEANTVKDQLKTVGNMDSSVFTLSVPKIDFKITGENSGYEAVNSSFKTYLEIKDKVSEVAVRLDKKELTKEQAKKEIDALGSQLKSALSSIEKLSHGEEKLQRFVNVYKETITLFDGISESDEIIFSAGIKNIYIHMVCSYSQYVKSLTS